MNCRLVKSRLINNVVLAVVFSLVACKKSDDKPAKTIPIKVTEPESGSPVSDANVMLFQCTGNFGCYGSIEVFSGVTDKDGICRVPLDDFMDETVHLNVFKDKYWHFIELPRINEVTLTPEAWIVVNVKRDGNYPAQSNLAVFTVSEKYGRNGNSVVSNIPEDTTFMIRAFGDEQNSLGWQVNDGVNQIFNEGQMTGLFVAKFDTLNAPDLRY